MKGIVVPDRTEDFTADPVELFFDLAYVFAFSQLVAILIHDHDWAAAGEAGLLFGLLWLPWSTLTWSANAVSGNGRQIRLVFLVATVVSVPMAAATSSPWRTAGRCSRSACRRSCCSASGSRRRRSAPTLRFGRGWFGGSPRTSPR